MYIQHVPDSSPFSSANDPSVHRSLDHKLRRAILSSAEPAAASQDIEAATVAAAASATATEPTPAHEAVTDLFRGEVAQVRVWSSPCSESSLQRTVGRSGVFQADSTLVILWKADEGAGDVLRNSRPLHPPKPARGSKAAVSGGGGGGGTGAEGHAELLGEWAWVPCFDPDDYESASPSAGGLGLGLGQASRAAGVRVADLAGAVDAPSSSSSTAQRSGRQGEEALGELTEGSTDTDLARSLGWRSVSTAGDEEEEEEEGEGEGGEPAGVSVPGRGGRGSGSEGRANSSPSFSACADAGVNATAAGASAALEAYAAIERGAGVGDDGGVRRLPPREALLGLLGKLFQQCSVYLEPCRGDPLVESTPPPRGVRVEARVQLQQLRREERALRAIVQPEVRRWCQCCQRQSARCTFISVRRRYNQVVCLFFDNRAAEAQRFVRISSSPHAPLTSLHSRAGKPMPMPPCSSLRVPACGVIHLHEDAESPFFFFLLETTVRTDTLPTAAFALLLLSSTRCARTCSFGAFCGSWRLSPRV